MNLTLSLKTLFRTAGKTAATFALLAAVTFMLAYNLIDYTLTKREFDSVIESYDGVLSVDYGTPNYTSFEKRLTSVFASEYLTALFFCQI
jgi:hypothetical protein